MSSPELNTYLRLVAPVRGRILVAIGMTVISSICGFLPYVAITQVAQRTFYGGIPPFGELLAWMALAILGALFGRFLFAIATGICHYADADFRVYARTVLIDHLGKVPLGWFTENSSAAAKQGATDDVLNMHQSVGHAPVDVTAAILSPTIPLVYLFVCDWRFALVILAFFALILAVMTPFMMKDFKGLNESYNESIIEVSSATVEMIDGIAVVKTFGAASRASQRFKEAIKKQTEICYVWTKKTANPTSLVFALFSPAAVLVFLLGVSLVFLSMGWMSFPQCIPFLVLGVGVPSSIISLLTAFRFMQSSSVGVAHLSSILEVRPLPEVEAPTEVSGESITVGFKDVSFAYSENASLALREIDAELAPGTLTALVGGSGSGKTTFARLIPRFWDPSSGFVAFNEVDLREMATSHILSQVAIVFQETFILRESIRDNIRLCRPRASDEEVENAARRAQIHQRIMELTKGYDTVVGSDDGNLSGGEMQRVAIARAMLQDAPILVLDEATAHADPENETAIQKALSNLAQRRSTVVIAHRLNTITHADNILVLENGRVIERGTHEELLALGGRYEKLWQTQQVSDSVPDGKGKSLTQSEASLYKRGES